MQNQYNLENVKLEIEVNGADSYIVTTDNNENNQRFISNASVSASDNSSANPFGICGSKSYNFEVSDIDDLLSPANKDSQYYKKIKTGSKIKVYLENTESIDETDRWVPDGTYYITSISGGFSEGYYDAVNISCKDKLENIGSASNPKIPCLRNIRVDDFLGIILSPLAKGTDWDIDDALGSKILLFGITVGEKISDTLNALAQFLQARIMINRENKITIRSATKIYGNTYVLSYDLVQSMSNIYDDSVSFSKITANYNVDGFKIVDVLLNDNSYTFKSGVNEPINNIYFINKALSIYALSIIYDKHKYNSVLNINGYTGHQDGLDNLKVTVEGEDIDACTIYAEGASIDKSTRKEEIVLYESDESGIELNIDIKYIIKQSEASSLVVSLAELVDKMANQIVIRTLATPHIDIGDRIVLEDADFTSTYIGSYRVIAYNTTHGLDYNNTLTLIRE